MSTPDTPPEKPARRRGPRGIFKTLGKILLWGLLVLLVLFALAWWYFHPSYSLREDIVYTQRNGVDLSYDVVTPKNPNGAAVLLMVSGSWKSSPDSFEPWLSASMLRRGFTVVAISHLSQPKATIAEIVDDVNLAVAHVRDHASDYGVDPQRFGVTGGSSGGHLALMLATQDRFKPSSREPAIPIYQDPNPVQAVAVFFPVTDLVDLGPSTQNPGDGGPPMSYVAGFGFKGRDDDPKRIAKADMAAWKKMAEELSPIYNLGGGLPAILIHHGDADTLVPLEQSQRFVALAEELGTGERIELVVRPGRGHGWITMFWDVRQFAKWFEKQLVFDQG